MPINNLPTSNYGTLSFTPLKSEITSEVALGNILVIEHQGFYAEISLYGGQVLKFQQAKQKPIFWLSEQIHCGLNSNGKHTAVRGGVPICWPWFGPHPENKSAKHGFARDLMWQLTKIVITDQKVTVQLMLSGENNHALWPQPFKLTQDITFSVNANKAFEQKLTMANLSDRVVEYTGALHSYLQVSSPENVTVPHLEQATFFDQLSTKNYSPTLLPNCQGPIDRIYHTNEEVDFIDNGWGRTLKITARNTHQWVLWNPGKDGAINMPDVHENGEQGFVCLEAANTQWQSIEPQSSCTISQVVTIK